MLILLSMLAQAQMLEAACYRSIGFSGGIAPGGRDWDLTTPGSYATTASPHLAQMCEYRAVWMGVEITPLYQHSYRRLGIRAPVVGLYTTGIAFHIGDADIGPVLVTNLVTVGGGLRFRYDRDLPTEGWLTGFDVRVAVLTGTDPDIQLVISPHFRRDRVGGRIAFGPDPHAEPTPEPPTEPVEPPAEGDPTVAEPVTPETPPEDEHNGRVRVTMGFESGIPIAARVRVGNKYVGLTGRYGVVTSFRRELAAQPIALADLDFGYADGPHALVGGGFVRRGSEWTPVGDVEVTLGNQAMLNFGLLVGPDLVLPQTSIGLMW